MPNGDHRPYPYRSESQRRWRSAGLSPRETEVLLAWLRHDSKSAVTAELPIAIGTVNTHISRIREKYAACGRPAPTKAALVARALQDGLVELHEL